MFYVMFYDDGLWHVCQPGDGHKEYGDALAQASRIEDDGLQVKIVKEYVPVTIPESANFGQDV